MKRYLRIVAVFALAASAISAGTSNAQPATGDTDYMTLKHYASQRSYIRERAHAIKVSKCRSHERLHFGRAASAVPAWHRSASIARWKRLREYARNRSSACSVVPAWITSAFLCIKSHEGAWTSNTGNGYYGGLQMDMSFQATYGGEFLSRYGTADNWSPSTQILVGYRAWQTRGFYPWPATAAMCGLI